MTFVFRSFYNALPAVNVASDAADKLVAVRFAMASIIARHGLADKFGVRLVHKHFEMLPNEVAAFRSVSVPGVCKAVIMGPVNVDKMTQMAGKNFAVDANGQLIAYEYTSDAGGNPNNFPAFAKEISELIVSSDATRIFGITCEPKAIGEGYTEFECPSARSTIMIPSRLFPEGPDEKSLQTIWTASTGKAGGEYTDACVTRRDNHVEVRCQFTRSTHIKTRDGDEGVPEDNTKFDKALSDPASPVFKVVHYVSAMM